MLASTRERFGLGSPPKDYNKNANEAINSMARREKETNKLSMREGVQLMQQEVSYQDEKVKLVIIGKGKFVFGFIFLFFTECGHPTYHNEAYYEPVILLKNQIFLH